MWQGGSAFWDLMTITVFRAGFSQANAGYMSRKPKRLRPFSECTDCYQTGQTACLHGMSQSSYTDALSYAPKTTGDTSLVKDVDK